eukprot:762823-Hanusia_phi.AAC.2
MGLEDRATFYVANAESLSAVVCMEDKEWRAESNGEEEEEEEERRRDRWGSEEEKEENGERRRAELSGMMVAAGSCRDL